MRTILLLACCLLLDAGLAGSAAARPAEEGNDPHALAREALSLAEAGQLDAATARQLANDPLVSWIDYATLHRELDSVDAATVRAWLERNQGQVAATMLRDEWLAELDQRSDWKTFREFHTADSSPKLRCADLAARMDAGEPDPQWFDDALALWRGGDAQPADCDAAFALLDARGKLTPELRWKRIDAAAENSDTSVMRSAARGLPADQAALALAYASFIDTPNESAAGWPRTERSRHVIAIGLARSAHHDPDGAEARLARLMPAMQLGEADRGRVQYAIALWTVASYAPGSAKRLAAVPASAYDAKLHEWQVREAMTRGDDTTALKAIAAMDPAQRSDPRWQYFEARLRERAGDTRAANALYAQAARTATYHGFLAADRLHQPYDICPLELSASDGERAKVAATPALVRAFELFQIDRIGWAEKEWKQALSGFDDHQRQIAVALAKDIGWYDRATFALGVDSSGKPAPDELRLYSLRFPLDDADTVRQQARENAIDPAWVAAEIRAESAWMPYARSGADARGLMQLLPSAGARLARTMGIAWSGGDTLYDPRTSIVLGSAYLRQMLDRYDGRTYLAIGAYNAGGTPVSRWLAERGQLDPDFWIETVDYKETRDYIMRVLAFSVIYDWRFDGKATSLSDRMLGRIVPDAKKQRFACALPATAVQPAATEAAR
ncbi:MAG TPA: transglycosylase SLT domain-containing protein [Xanthomonadaceae bacterium]|nr:transglycosylase SLT domain-containing protein [Xanthomonadaceae bacterium]